LPTPSHRFFDDVDNAIKDVQETIAAAAVTSADHHTQSPRLGTLEELAPAVLRTRAREPPAKGFHGGGDAARDNGRQSLPQCWERGGEGGSRRAYE